MYEMYYANFHMKSVTLFFHETHIIIFKHARQQQPCTVFNRSTSLGFVAQNFREFFFKSHPYSPKHMTVVTTTLDY